MLSKRSNGSAYLIDHKGHALTIRHAPTDAGLLRETQLSAHKGMGL